MLLWLFGGDVGDAPEMAEDHHNRRKTVEQVLQRSEKSLSNSKAQT